MPPAVPQVLGVQFTGGFLDGQVIHLSPNLNCIIGGRGTGKSTTFEALGCLSEDRAAAASSIPRFGPVRCPSTGAIQPGVEHSLQKLTGEQIANLDDPDFGPVQFAMDCYGQGETTRLGQRAKNDPLALLDFLDTFMDLKEARETENAARDSLLELQKKIEEAEQKVALIPRFERDLKTTQQQLKASEKANAKEVIDLQRKLATERELRGRIAEKWHEANSVIVAEELTEKLEEIRTVANPSDLTVGAKELRTIVDGADALGKQVTALHSNLRQQATTSPISSPRSSAPGRSKTRKQNAPSRPSGRNSSRRVSAWTWPSSGSSPTTKPPTRSRWML